MPYERRYPRRGLPVEEHTVTLDGSPVFFRRAPATGLTPVYLHTAPTSSDDWLALLERTGGIAPDLIGFGRSGKGGHLDYSPDGIARFVTALVDELGIERVGLVGHGWGAAVAATLAARQPERVSRLVLIDAAPPLLGVWPRLARGLRTPVVGELVMGSVNRALLARWLRGASQRSEAWPDARVSAVWEHFDQGTQRATLRLHRWAARGGADELTASLESLRVPTAVLWGTDDPWFAADPAREWTDRIPGARLELVEQAGHWPWLDRPEVAERLADLTAAP